MKNNQQIQESYLFLEISYFFYLLLSVKLVFSVSYQIGTKIFLNNKTYLFQ